MCRSMSRKCSMSRTTRQRPSPTIRSRIRPTTTRPPPIFAGAVTGVLWGAAIDWDDWDVWGGGWVAMTSTSTATIASTTSNGKVNWNDVNWKNVDRSKITFDRIAGRQSRSHEHRRTASGPTATTPFEPKLRTMRRERPTIRAGQAPNRDARKSTLGDQEGFRRRRGRRTGRMPVINRGDRRQADRRASIVLEACPRPAPRWTRRPEQAVGTGKRQSRGSPRQHEPGPADIRRGPRGGDREHVSRAAANVRSTRGGGRGGRRLEAAVGGRGGGGRGGRGGGGRRR